MEKNTYVRIDGQILRLSNLEKVFYPETGFTKGDVVRFYRKMGAIVLPHLRNRPFTLRRFPSGTAGEGFFEKKCPAHRPPWVETGVFSEVQFCLVNDLKTLVWAANLAAIELHTTLAVIANMQQPTTLAFDLDPGEGTGLQECAQIALILEKLLRSFGLEAFPKTSGGKGLHVYVPLNTGVTYQMATPFARHCAELLEKAHPDRITSRMMKKLRIGKVLIDWSQNVESKTTVCVYSLRANERPTVSVPLKWPEVRSAARTASRAAGFLSMEAGEVHRRVERWGDLFKPVLELRQNLPWPVT